MSAAYQVIHTGARDVREQRLEKLVTSSMRDLGLEEGSINFLDGRSAAVHDRLLPSVVIFYGATSEVSDTLILSELLQQSLIVVPLVPDVDSVGSHLPPQLAGINAFAVGDEDDRWNRLGSLILEAFRLLRKERRVFISYKRSDSQALANRLYEELDKRGFDVFIDVRSVPPAADFQSVLWHRMADSDLVVLIDTPEFRKSRWTTAELAQANATNVQILHLLWPGQEEDVASSFSHFLSLATSDFDVEPIGQGGSVSNQVIERICAAAERLRAQAMAARHRYLVDSFCDAARDLGLSPTVQPERWIKVGSSTKTCLVVPIVGVPTSDRINAVFEAAIKEDEVWAIYDNRGILSDWVRHLEWLADHLPVRILQMSRVPKTLEAFMK